MSQYMSTVKVGPKGQIVIPKEIREMFGIGPGESLIIMADSVRGIALHKQSVMEGIAKAIFDGNGGSIYPGEDQKNLESLANAVKETREKGECER